MAAEASWNPFNIYQRWKEHRAEVQELANMDDEYAREVAPHPPCNPRKCRGWSLGVGR